MMAPVGWQPPPWAVPVAWVDSRVRPVTTLVCPVPAPRMSRQDQWKDKQSPAVQRYTHFCDNVRKRKRLVELIRSGPCVLDFFLPMPKSWSQEQKDAAIGREHESTPDLDNLVKALLDACFYKTKGGDSKVWLAHASKRWDIEGYFMVQPLIVPPSTLVDLTLEDE